MTTGSESDKGPGWDLPAVSDWLLAEGRFLPDLEQLAAALGDRLAAAGADLWRLRISMRTLHPLVAGVTAIWERDGGTPIKMSVTHGLEGRSGYIGSPLAIIAETGAPYRKDLRQPLTGEDHGILHDLVARGATDYFGIPMRTTSGRSAVLVLTSDGAAGFSEGDIAGYLKLAALLAPIVEVYSSQDVAVAVAEAYLGKRTGQRVLEGRITRGDIEKIEAAILISDIRGWTLLNNRLAPEAALALANRYFEIVVAAVEAHGGEVLKFLGDGLLAIFPVGDEESSVDAAQACGNALAAARQALQSAETAEPPLGADFGLGLHFGEVLYGNIGSESRIDFTVLGQAVNLAARIEGLCSGFGEALFYSEVFAGHLPTPSRRVGREELKGFDTAFEIFTDGPAETSTGSADP